MTVFSFIYRSVRAIDAKIYKVWCALIAAIKLKGNQVKYGNELVSNGTPKIDVHRSGKMTIGDNFSMNNGKRYNTIGRQQPCYFVVRANAELTIGNNAGISATAIVCAKKITIGDNVKIGGNTVIYDTDFHSLDHVLRADKTKDAANAKNASVNIGNNAFIGAHSTVLKGVTIGEGAIIGASSVVTANVPPYEIWAGNPARFIKKAPEVEKVKLENVH
jgi:acetyltransferase-like isoleucine patch superfamily enzyme